MITPDSDPYRLYAKPPTQVVKMLLSDINGNFLVGIRAFNDKRGGTLDFLGGKVEPEDASIEAAGVREVWQEGGLVVDEQDLHVADVDMSIGESTGNVNVVTYLSGFLFDDVAMANIDQGEMAEVLMMPGLEVIQRLQHPAQAEVFTRYFLRHVAVDMSSVHPSSVA